MGRVDTQLLQACIQGQRHMQALFVSHDSFIREIGSLLLEALSPVLVDLDITQGIFQVYVLQEVQGPVAFVADLTLQFRHGTVLPCYRTLEGHLPAAVFLSHFFCYP